MQVRCKLEINMHIDQDQDYINMHIDQYIGTLDVVVEFRWI